MVSGEWVLMTHDMRKPNVPTLTLKEDESVGFGGNQIGKIIVMGSIGNSSPPAIENILLLDGLKYNLRTIIQLCDSCYEVTFDKNYSTVINQTDKFIFFIGNRKGNVYKIKSFDLAYQKVVCLLSMNDDKWL
jgi:hypothetical protein